MYIFEYNLLTDFSGNYSKINYAAQNVYRYPFDPRNRTSIFVVGATRIKHFSQLQPLYSSSPYNLRARTLPGKSELLTTSSYVSFRRKEKRGTETKKRTRSLEGDYYFTHISSLIWFIE